MANISQIELPNGTTYDIEDTVARGVTLDATYTAATYNLSLTLDTADDADEEDF